MEIVPFENDLPDEIDVEWYNLEEAEQLKRLKADNLLPEYYTDSYVDEGIVRVGDIDQYDGGPVLEKRMKTDEELPYSLLVESLGVGPEFRYVREENGELYAGMEFMREFGMVEDLDYDGFDDFLDYIYCTAVALGSLWDVGLMHNDVTRSEMSGEFNNTRYVANVMTSGSDDEARLIDFERTTFEDRKESEDIGTNLNNSVEDEKRTVRQTLVSEAARSFEDRINDVYLEDNEIQDFFELRRPQLVRVLDVNSLPGELSPMIGEIENEFNKGVADGNVNPVKMQEYFSAKVIEQPEINSSKPHEAAVETFEHLEDWLEENL